MIKALKRRKSKFFKYDKILKMALNVIKSLKNLSKKKQKQNQYHDHSI